MTVIQRRIHGQQGLIAHRADLRDGGVDALLHRPTSDCFTRGCSPTVSPASGRGQWPENSCNRACSAAAFCVASASGTSEKKNQPSPNALSSASCTAAMICSRDFGPIPGSIRNRKAVREGSDIMSETVVSLRNFPDIARCCNLARGRYLMATSIRGRSSTDTGNSFRCSLVSDSAGGTRVRRDGVGILVFRQCRFGLQPKKRRGDGWDHPSQFRQPSPGRMSGCLRGCACRAVLGGQSGGRETEKQCTMVSGTPAGMPHI